MKLSEVKEILEKRQNSLNRELAGLWYCYQNVIQDLIESGELED